MDEVSREGLGESRINGYSFVESPINSILLLFQYHAKPGRFAGTPGSREGLGRAASLIRWRRIWPIMVSWMMRA